VYGDHPIQRRQGNLKAYSAFNELIRKDIGEKVKLMKLRMLEQWSLYSP